MTSHRDPAVTKSNPPTDLGHSPDSAETGVQAGDMAEVRDEQKVAPKHLRKGKNKNHVPLVKASTTKKKGEKPKEGEEEELMENKKKDGCGCDKKKKKMDGLTPGRFDACWKSHEQKGTKMKGGKVVPNCVPKGKSKKKDACSMAKKDSVFASGFKFDGKALHMESQNLAATEIDRAKRKKNAQGQPKNFIYAKTRNT